MTPHRPLAVTDTSDNLACVLKSSSMVSFARWTIEKAISTTVRPIQRVTGVSLGSE